MKKTLSLILVLVLCLSLCACGTPKTELEAFNKASDIMKKWTAQHKDKCSYITERNDSFGLFVNVTVESPGGDDSITRGEHVLEIAENVNEELLPLFRNFNTKVAVSVYNADNSEILCSTINGEMMDLFFPGTGVIKPRGLRPYQVIDDTYSYKLNTDKDEALSIYMDYLNAIESYGITSKDMSYNDNDYMHSLYEGKKSVGLISLWLSDSSSSLHVTID